MTNYDHITRRKVLGSLGVVGAGAALGGTGTMAFFSDRETYGGNRLVAGELDLKVDWQEHYSDWSNDENDDWVIDLPGIHYDEPDESEINLDEDDADDFEVVMTDGDQSKVPPNHVGLPYPDEPLLAVPVEFLDDFMHNTAVEAYPDEDGDGVQDRILTRQELNGRYKYASAEQIEEKYREQFADVPDDLERPLIHLSDVKPGDFGEVTFSFHLFDNPGYIWFDGQLIENAENGVNDPEADDPDENDPEGPDSGTATSGELLDAIQAVVWHDDGDNVINEEEWTYPPHSYTLPSSIILTKEQAEISRGSLRDVLEELATGLPLDANPKTSKRECFPNSTTRYLGFAWWLPVDHANEIQTDSVTFDLGFYTEQCRHNDGSRQAPEDTA